MDANNTIATFQEKHKYFLSQDVTISCGCVPVDPSARKVALVHDPSTGAIFLPKGRKNISEGLLAAALRETHEETGVRCTALPLKVATRATPTEEMVRLGAVPEENPSVTVGVESCEPTSVCAFLVPEGLKMIFHFAATGNSSEGFDKGTKESWEAHWSTEWVDAREAAGRATTEEDAKAITKVLDDMKNSGYDI